MPLNARDLWLFLRAQNMGSRDLKKFANDIRDAGAAVRLAQLEAEKANLRALATQQRLTLATKQADLTHLQHTKTLQNEAIRIRQADEATQRLEIAMLKNDKALLQNTLRTEQLTTANEEYINDLKLGILEIDEQINRNDRLLIQHQEMTSRVKEHVGALDLDILSRRKDIETTKNQTLETRRRIAAIDEETRTIKNQIKEFTIKDELDKLAEKHRDSFYKRLFSPNRQILGALRTGIPSVLSSPIGLAAIALAVIFAANFIGAVASVMAAGGLGAVIIAAGVAGLLALNDKAKAAGQKLVDTLKGVFQRAVQPLAGPFITSLGLIEKAAKRLEPIFTRIFARLAPMMVPVVNGLIGMVEKVLPGIEKSMAGIDAVLNALGKHLPRLGTAIGDFFAELTKDPELLERVTGILITMVSGFFKVLGPLLERLMLSFAVWTNLWRAFFIILHDGSEAATNIRKKFEEMVESEGLKQVKDAFAALKESAGKFFQALREFARADDDQEILTKLNNLRIAGQDLWKKLTDFLKEVWNLAWGEIKRVWREDVEPWLRQKLSDFLDWLIEQFRAKLTQMKNEAIQTVLDMVKNVVEILVQLPIKVGVALISLPLVVANAFLSAARQADNIVRGLAFSVPYLLGQMINNVGGLLSRLPGIFMTNFLGAWGQAINWSENIRATVVARMYQLVGGVASVLSSLPGIVFMYLARTAGEAFRSGAQIVQNLINGMRSKIPDLIGVIGTIGRIVRDFLPGSPVKRGPLRVLNHGYAGGQIVKMVADGIKSNAGLLSKQFETSLLPPDFQAQAGVRPQGEENRQPVTQNFYITTQEINPRFHAAQLGWELEGRL